MRFWLLTAALTLLSPMAFAINCFVAERGPHLALCLRSCDGQSLTVDESPSYDELRSEIDQAVFTGTIKRVVTDEMVRTAISGGVCNTSTFPGDQCLIRTSRRIFSRRRNPIDVYEALLNERNRQMGNNILQPQVSQLLHALRNLRGQMRTARVQGFDREGAFFEQNIKNAPAYLCQLESLDTQNGKSLSDLASATEANLREIERGADFFTGYRP